MLCVCSSFTCLLPLARHLRAFPTDPCKKRPQSTRSPSASTRSTRKTSSDLAFRLLAWGWAASHGNSFVYARTIPCDLYTKRLNKRKSTQGDGPLPAHPSLKTRLPWLLSLSCHSLSACCTHSSACTHPAHNPTHPAHNPTYRQTSVYNLL